MTTTIQKWGNSQGIRIPKPILEELNISENEEVDLIVENNSLVIKKVNKRKTIQELFEGYDGIYKPKEYDWGKPMGKEVW